MLVVRLIILLLFVGVSASLLSWLITGKTVFRTCAWYSFLTAMALLLVLMLMLVLERLFFA